MRSQPIIGSAPTDTAAGGGGPWGSADIVDGSLTGADIADGSITAADITFASGWEQIIDLPGSSLTGWSYGNGTGVTVNGPDHCLSAPDTSTITLRYDGVNLGLINYVQCELRFDAFGGVSTQAGIGVGPRTGSGANMAFSQLATAGGDGTAATITVEQFFVGSFGSGPVTNIATGVWYTVGFLTTGAGHQVFFDGTAGPAGVIAASSGCDRLALVQYAARCSWRNIKAWNLSILAAPTG